jgi:hypothetical protein
MPRLTRSDGPWSAATWGGTVGGLLGAACGLLLLALAGSEALGGLQAAALSGLYWGAIGACAGLQARLSIVDGPGRKGDLGPALGGGALGAVVGGLLLSWALALVYAAGALFKAWMAGTPVVVLFLAPLCWVPLYAAVGMAIGLLVSLRVGRTS